MLETSRESCYSGRNTKLLGQTGAATCQQVEVLSGIAPATFHEGAGVVFVFLRTFQPSADAMKTISFASFVPYDAIAKEV
jgi:hypothetical protein